MDQTVIMARKQMLIATTNTPGWQVALQIAEQIAEDAAQKVINCEDETDVIKLQRKAQAAREFVTEFRSRVEEMRRLEVSEPGKAFIPVALD